jgi:hypothetical protein
MGGLVVNSEIREFTEAELFRMFKVVVGEDKLGRPKYYKPRKTPKVKMREARAKVLQTTYHNGEAVYRLSEHSQLLAPVAPVSERTQAEHDAKVAQLAEFYQSADNIQNEKSYFDV